MNGLRHCPPLLVCSRLLVYLTLYVCVVGSAVTLAQAELPVPTVWTVGEDRREALVIPPSQPGAGPVPVVFVFHGHGGTMQRMAQLDFQAQWPAALVVCPQGLPTVTPRDPKGLRAGWQLKLTHHGDRDLKFFDAMLTTLRQTYDMDQTRIFVTGYSNGGGFTYLLLASRGGELAAVAPVAALAGSLRAPQHYQPRPVLHVAGERDSTVPFRFQQRSMDLVHRLNGCAVTGTAWASAGTLVGTQYASRQTAPFIAVIHPGTHSYPAEAPTLIVKFFQQYPLKPPAEQ